MTEAEWLACRDPVRLLTATPVPLTERKLRLIGVACCRAVWGHFTDGTARDTVEVVERFADAAATNSEMGDCRQSLTERLAGAWGQNRAGRARAHPAEPVMNVAHTLALVERGRNAAALIAENVTDAVEDLSRIAARDTPPARLADLVRDIAGNPFRPVTLAPEWRTADAVGVADAIYAGRTFHDLPILADALQDAGCDLADLLDHLRRPGPHARGCWALDLVLGRG